MMEIEYIMILHIVHNYIPYNKINPKNHKQYIFQILSRNGHKFSQKGPFLNFPKKCENVIFRLQRLGLVQKISKF